MSKKAPVHIFIIEDGTIFNKMLEYIFTKDIKFRFMDFKSCEECAEHLHLEPHIIMMDHCMCETKGSRKILNIKEEKPSTNLVMMVHHADGDAQREVENRGNDYVLKNENDITPIIKKLEHYLSFDMLRLHNKV